MVGGFVSTGHTQIARVRWCVTMGLYMAFLAMTHHEGWGNALVVLLLVTAGTFLGRMIPHGQFESVASLWNSLAMGLITVVRMALIVVPYAVTNWPTVLGSPLQLANIVEWQPIRLIVIGLGLLAGAAYYAGNAWLDGEDVGLYYRSNKSQWRMRLPKDTEADKANAMDQCAVGGTEWGELLTGNFVYKLSYMALLLLP